MFIFSVSAIFVSGLFFLRRKIKNGKLFFLLLSGIILCLYSGLRGHNLQPDIPRYVQSYQQYAKYSFREIIALYSSEIRDPSYYFTAWLFSRLFTDAQWWLAFVGAVYIVAVLLVVYKESENPLMSVLMIISLGYFSFILSGLRQCFAMSLISISYLYLKNKKPIKFILLVLFASLFHLSSIVFLIMYPICRIKYGLLHIIAFIVLLVLFLGFQSTVRNLMSRFMGDSQYGGYLDSETTLNFSGFVVQVCMFVFNLFYYLKLTKEDENAIILYNMAFIGLSLQLFSSMIAEFFRLSYYFSFANILLVPLSIKTEPDKKTRDILTVIISLLFIVYMFWDGVPEYSFFWQ